MPSSGVATLFEHQTRGYAELGWSPVHPMIRSLDTLNRAAGHEVVRLERSGIRALEYVGVFRVGSHTLQVLPKVDFEPSGDPDAEYGSESRALAARSASSNLLEMVSYAYEFPIRNVHVAGLQTARGSWLEILTRLFASELHSLVQRGIERYYIPVQETSNVLRGRWEIEKQLIRRPHQRHLFDIVRDEFSENTPLNRVLKYTTERLLAASSDPRNRALLMDLREWFSEVSSLPSIGLHDLRQVAFTRLNDRYAPAFNMARLLIDGEIAHLRAGSEELTAFALDMNLLFERFVAGLATRFSREILPEPWRGYALVTQMKNRPTYLLERLPQHTQEYRVVPDICVLDSRGRVQAIIDTKYKEMEEGPRGHGPSEADLYQLLAYCSRLGCHAAALLFPSSKRAPGGSAIFTAIEGPQSLVVDTIDLHSPLGHPKPLIDGLRALFSQLRFMQERELVDHGAPEAV